MSIFSDLIDDVEASAKTSASAIVSSVLGLFSGAFLELAEDEIVIIGDALASVRTALKAGESWEEALTAALNTFYNEEVTEAKKISMAVLESISKLMAGVQAL